MKFLLIQVVLIGIVTRHVRSSVRCATPDGLTGRCVHPNSCKPLVELRKRPQWLLTVRDSLLLTFSKCSENQRRLHEDRVCCPDHSQQLIAVQPATCVTLNGQMGICRNIQSCSTLSGMLYQRVSQYNMAYIVRSRCNELQQYNVCCGPAQPLGMLSHQTTSISMPYLEEPLPNDICTLSAIPPDPKSNCCGTHDTDLNRIVGGTETTIDEYPWLVLIEYRMKGTNMIKILCGGSLISGRYVLTASHCLIGNTTEETIPVNVRLGEYNISNPGPDCVFSPGGGEDCTNGPLVISIEEIITHEQYDQNDINRRNDIALIRLSKTAPYSDFIRPICLPTFDLTASDLEGQILYASGWGMTEYENTLTSVKRDVELPFQPFELCQEIYNKINVTLSRGQMCAGGVPGKDACRGDSGGPLMLKKKEHYEVTAVVSFGPKPCGQDIPSVYTNVYAYLPWIRDQITS